MGMSKEAILHNRKNIKEWHDKLDEENAKAYCIIGMRSDGSTTMCTSNSVRPDSLAIQLRVIAAQLEQEYKKSIN